MWLLRLSSLDDSNRASVCCLKRRPPPLPSALPSPLPPWLSPWLALSLSLYPFLSFSLVVSFFLSLSLSCLFSLSLYVGMYVYEYIHIYIYTISGSVKPNPVIHALLLTNTSLFACSYLFLVHRHLHLHNLHLPHLPLQFLIQLENNLSLHSCCRRFSPPLPKAFHQSSHSIL